MANNLYFISNKGYAYQKKNWSLTSGGEAGNTIPTAETNVIIDNDGICIFGYPLYYRVWCFIIGKKLPNFTVKNFEIKRKSKIIVSKELTIIGDLSIPSNK